jgi:hypothetical protein
VTTGHAGLRNDVAISDEKKSVSPANAKSAAGRSNGSPGNGRTAASRSSAWLGAARTLPVPIESSTTGSRTPPQDSAGGGRGAAAPHGRRITPPRGPAAQRPEWTPPRRPTAASTALSPSARPRAGRLPDGRRLDCPGYLHGIPAVPPPSHPLHGRGSGAYIRGGHRSRHRLGGAPWPSDRPALRAEQPVETTPQIEHGPSVGAPSPRTRQRPTALARSRRAHLTNSRGRRRGVLRLHPDHHRPRRCRRQRPGGRMEAVAAEPHAGSFLVLTSDRAALTMEP